MRDCVYLNDWAGVDAARLMQDFALSSRELDGVELLLASYSYDAYSGEAFVLFRHSGVLFEVNASHNSSDDIRGQWEPEDTFIRALQFRLDNGRLGRNEEAGERRLSPALHIAAQ